MADTIQKDQSRTEHSAIKSRRKPWYSRGCRHLPVLITAAIVTACSPQESGPAQKKISESLKVIEAKKSLNAFTYVALDQAQQRAALLDKTHSKGLMTGFTLAVKDNIHVAGMPNTAGTAALADFVPKASSPVVEALEKSGAIVMGKAGLHELAYGITNNNFAFGAVRNPHDPDKIPGGSSGGSAAAVAAGMVDAALGTDTGGSVRLPAALTGVYGYRPTTGRYSADEVTLISPTRDTVGLMARSMADIVRMDQVIMKSPQRQEGKQAQVDLSQIRIGVPKAYFYDDLDPEVARVSQEFLQKLTALGVTLVYEDLDQVPDLNAKVSFPVVLYETAEVLPAYFKKHGLPFDKESFIQSIKSPDVKGILSHALSGGIAKNDYIQAKTVHRPQLQAAYKAYFDRHQVQAVLFPTTPITARNIDGILDGVMVNGVKKDTFATYIRNTDPASNAGLPGISVPAGMSKEGLPVGMEFDGPAGQDAVLLQLVQQIMQALKAQKAE